VCDRLKIQQLAHAAILAKIANQVRTCHIVFMPTRNINLTDNQDRFVAQALSSGRYQNASEVVRDGLRMLERREAEDAAKLARLRGALAEAEGALAIGDFEDVDVENLDGWLADLSAETR
jgi:antitoxin ParD1/3/4